MGCFEFVVADELDPSDVVGSVLLGLLVYEVLVSERHHLELEARLGYLWVVYVDVEASLGELGHD